VTFFMSDFS